MLVAVVTSSCDLRYSTPPAVTDTPNPNSLFASPIAQTPSMSDVEIFGTGTALALTGTPVGGVPTQTLGVPVAGSVTPTPLISTIPGFTSTATLAVGGGATSAATYGPLPTSAPVGYRPATYTLQPGEFPYCIARRFDVNPDDLLSINGLANGSIYYPNLALKIPQSGNFPGTRALRTHPTTYTVASSGETIYGVACLFGDVDPAAVAQANNVSPGAPLTAGKQLSIP